VSADPRNTAGLAARLSEEAHGELLERIAHRAPSFAERGPEDPARVLVEALADALGELRAEASALEEGLLPRLLEHFGEEPRWARAAGGAVAFSLASGVADPVLVPRGTIVAAPRRPGEPKVAFELETDAWASPARLARAVASAGGRVAEIFPHPQGGWDGDPVDLFGGRTAIERHVYIGDTALLLLAAHAAEVVLEWPSMPPGAPDARWEYSVPDGWRPLRVEIEDSRGGGNAKGIAPRRSVRIRIAGPLPGLSEESVHGVSAAWIRLSLPPRKRVTLNEPSWCEAHAAEGPEGGALEGRLAFPRPVERILSGGGESWEDHSLAGAKINPADGDDATDPAVYLGWEEPAAASLYFSFASRPAPAGWMDRDARRPAVEWEHSTRRGFRKLDAEDGTLGFSRSGIVAWKMPPEWTAQEHFGERLHWVRARWVGGAHIASPALKALIPNAAAIREGRTLAGHLFEASLDASGRAVVDLALGGAEPERFPVLEIRGEAGWTRLREARFPQPAEMADGDDASAADDDADVEVGAAPGSGGRFSFRRRQQGGHTLEVGPRWTGRMAFRIPVLRATLGSRGNLPPGTLTVLEAEIPGIRRVIQPLPTGGGADAEAGEEHRRRVRAEWGACGRAVTAADHERLARAFDPGLARIECTVRPEEPWRITLHVVPLSETERGALPAARLEWLARAVAERAPLGSLIEVVEPLPLPVDVVLQATAGTAIPSDETRRILEERLRRWADPIRGGADGRGFPLLPWARAGEIAAWLEAALRGSVSGAVPESILRSMLPGPAPLDWDPEEWRLVLRGPGGEAPGGGSGDAPCLPAIERLVFERRPWSGSS